MKKVWIWLCVALLLAAPVFFVQAVEETVPPEQDLLRDPVLMAEAERIYVNSLNEAKRASFYGSCGLATSYQLWQLGINQELDVHDGNQQFDYYYYYYDGKSTTGGHTVRCYGASEYTLTEALNLISQNGTRTVYNILVGFQWTSTEAGATYGHACVINAIQDGIVYLTESFDHAFGVLEGKPGTCTIAEFEDFFDGWATYEGCVYFGTKQYYNSCQSYPTDLHVQLRFDSNLRSQPCLIGQNDCVRLRSLAAGELLYATAVYTNTEGDLFYQIDDGGVTGYVSANAVYLFQRNEAKVRMEGMTVPVSWTSGEKYDLEGQISVTGGQLVQLRAELTDEEGTQTRQVQVEVTGNSGDLAELKAPLELESLAAGGYQLTLFADMISPTAENGMLNMERASYVLLQQPLCVDCEVPELPSQEDPDSEDPEDRNGWFIKDGIWYCYENGQPYTGWATRIGVSYYLQDDGAVTTGWRQEDGQRQYFSATGALCSGWFTTPDGTYYWDDGKLATGLVQIDGVRYYFRENGKMVAGGMAEIEGATYRVGMDGRVTPIGSVVIPKVPEIITPKPVVEATEPTTESTESTTDATEA